MAIVNTYLTFNGNCKEAFDFYRSIFGGEFQYVGTYAEMPPQEGMSPIPKEMLNRIMHISLPISKETSIMGSDSGGEWTSNYEVGNSFSISINAQSKKEADHLYNGLSEGGKITMPLASTFWGDYFGMFTDKFGINWMVSFNENPKK